MVGYEDTLKIWSTSLRHGSKSTIKISLGLLADVGERGNNPNYNASAEYEGILTWRAYGTEKGQFKTESMFTEEFPAFDGLRPITAAAMEVPCWVGGTVEITCSLRPIALANEVSSDVTGESVAGTFHATLKTTIAPAEHVTFKAESKALYQRRREAMESARVFGCWLVVPECG